MFDILVKVMVVAALLELGISVADWEGCRSRGCLLQLEKKSRDVLKIEWKPISVFVRPEKRMRYRPRKDGLEPEVAGSERGLRSP